MGVHIRVQAGEEIILAFFFSIFCKVEGKKTLLNTVLAGPQCSLSGTEPFKNRFT